MTAVITLTNMHGLSTSLQNRQQQQHQLHHHHHHHHYNLTSSHHLLLTPSNTKTTSLNLQQTSIALGGKQQPQPLYGSMRQNNKTNNSGSSSSNRTYLPPLRLEYQQPYYMAEPCVTDSIVYADLALAGNGRREPHLLSHYRAPQNSTEYAILKFHDVGQEIDVWKGWYRHWYPFLFRVLLNIQLELFTRSETDFSFIHTYFDRFTSCKEECEF